MKNFFFKILLFGLCLAGISFLFDYMIQEGIKTTNYKEVTKWNEVVEGGIDAEHLVVGSSRAFVHFDMERLEEKTGKTGYNLGFNGFAYPQVKKTLELYLDRNVKPEKIT